MALAPLALAGTVKVDIHADSVTPFVDTLVQASADTMYVHMTETTPGYHCMDIEIPGGKASPFWAADGYKYSAPVRPGWTPGACDRSKGQWETLDSTVDNFDGWNGVTFRKYGYAGGHPYKPGTQGNPPKLAAMASNMVVSSVQPGGAHCNEITIIGEEANPYWAEHGYQYGFPTWKKEPCPERFNWKNNKSILAKGVTMQIKGVHVSAELSQSFMRAMGMGSTVESNICGLKWNYCPRDPGCATYTMSVDSVHTRDESRGPVKIENVKVGDSITVEMVGKTTLKEVPTAGSYRVYALKGGNVDAGVLADALTVSGGSFVFKATFKVSEALFQSAQQTNMFEFGVDVFQSSSGSNEGVCVEVASKDYVAAEVARVDPKFELMCDDNGDGTFTKLATPKPVVSTLTGADEMCMPPVDCKVSKWGEWSKCTKKCGGGSTSRSRTIVTPPARGGAGCPALTETQKCNAQECAHSDMEWYYCPRDPGCKTYTMSVDQVEMSEPGTVKAGDKVTVVARGKTSIRLKTIGASASYRVYALSGRNMATGVLAEHLKLDGAGNFQLTVPITVTEDAVVGGNVEFGIDVFQKGSGSDEGMCIEIASKSYVKEQQAKPSPPFNMYCTDNGDGSFTSHMPNGLPEKITPVTLSSEQALLQRPAFTYAWSQPRA
jgi:hypothetical protein